MEQFIVSGTGLQLLFFILLFLVGQTVLTVYAFCHLNERDSTYFTFDSLGVILSFVLALLSFCLFLSQLYISGKTFRY